MSKKCPSLHRSGAPKFATQIGGFGRTMSRRWFRFRYPAGNQNLIYGYHKVPSSCHLIPRLTNPVLRARFRKEALGSASRLNGTTGENSVKDSWVSLSSGLGLGKRIESTLVILISLVYYQINRILFYSSIHQKGVFYIGCVSSSDQKCDHAT